MKNRKHWPIRGKSYFKTYTVGEYTLKYYFSDYTLDDDGFILINGSIGPFIFRIYRMAKAESCGIENGHIYEVRLVWRKDFKIAAHYSGFNATNTWLTKPHTKETQDALDTLVTLWNQGDQGLEHTPA